MGAGVRLNLWLLRAWNWVQNLSLRDGYYFLPTSNTLFQASLPSGLGTQFLT